MRKKLCKCLLMGILLAIVPSTTIQASCYSLQNYQKNYVIGEGEEQKLDDKNLSSDDYLWQCSDETVVSFVKNGTVIGNEIGTANVACYSSSGVLVRRYHLTVKKAPKKMKLNVSKISEFPKYEEEIVPKINDGSVCNRFTFKSSDVKVAGVSNDGIIKTKSPGDATITVSTYNGVSKKIEVHVKNPKKAIAITFDDGPVNANTTRVLNVLKKNDYHATFFMIGQQVNGNEDLLKRMVKEGNEVGTHTWNHMILTNHSKAEMKSNLQKSMEAIKKACGQYPTVMRPPGGACNANVMDVCQDLGLPVIIWNNDTNDWRSQNKQAGRIKNIILNSVKPGQVVLLHDLHKTSVEGFVRAVPELKKRGFELVTVTELEKLHGDELKPGQKVFGYSK